MLLRRRAEGGLQLVLAFIGSVQLQKVVRVRGVHESKRSQKVRQKVEPAHPLSHTHARTVSLQLYRWVKPNKMPNCKADKVKAHL